MSNRNKKYIRKNCEWCKEEFLMSESGLYNRERYNIEMLCEDCMKERMRQKAQKLRDDKKAKENLLADFRRGDYALPFAQHYMKKTGRKLRIIT